MKKTKILIVMMFILLPFSAQGATYYVDGTLPEDYDGTSYYYDINSSIQTRVEASSKSSIDETFFRTYGVFRRRLIRFRVRCLLSIGWRYFIEFRYFIGDVPVHFLKALEKALCSEKPSRKAMSLMVFIGFLMY